eukprot:jgi/Botrbrau1/572/Bobra.0010s0038.1
MKYSEFGTYVPIWKTLSNLIVGMLGLMPDDSDNASVNIYQAAEAGEVIAMTELPSQYRVRLADLAAVKRKKPEGLGLIFRTAHPTFLEDGTLVNIGTAFHVEKNGGERRLLREREIEETDINTGKSTVLAKIPARSPTSPSWVHDFPATPNYVIVPETPVTFNMGVLLGGSPKYGLLDWQKDMPTLFHVVPLNGGEVKTVKGPPYMAFHYINVWESNDGKSLHVTVPTYKDPEIVNGLRLDRVRSDSFIVEPSRIQKITIPLDNPQAEAHAERVVRDNYYRCLEFPRINPLYKKKENRYTYGVTASNMPTNLCNSIGKFDMADGTYKLWHEPGAIPGEPIMVPHPNANDEDDGVVLCAVTAADGSSFLLLLDASSLNEVARCKLPNSLPYGFHGQWFNAA